MTIDLRQIECFCAVARSGSFSRAAAVLSMDQSGLSRQVRKLEESVRSPLFYRNGRGVELTACGAAFHESVSEAMSTLRKAYEQVAETIAVPCGRVSLALTPSLGAMVAVPLLQRLKAEWPQIKLHLVDGFPDAVQEALLSGRVDIAVVADQRAGPLPPGKPLLNEELYLIGTGKPDAAISSGRRDGWDVHAEDLLQLPLILPAWDHGLRATLKRLGLDGEAELDVVDETNSLLIMKEMVRARVGYAVLPIGCWFGDIAAGELVACRITGPSITNTLSIRHASNRPFSTAMRQVCASLREVVESTARERVGWSYIGA